LLAFTYNPVKHMQTRLEPTRVELPSKRRLLALPSNIRLGRMRVTNTLAYFGTELFTDVKSFIVHAGPMLENFLRLQVTAFYDKLECLSLAGLSSLV
jgi:hypothetical protein